MKVNSGRNTETSKSNSEHTIKNWRNQTTDWQHKYQTALSSKNVETAAIKTLEAEVAALEEVQTFVQEVAAKIEKTIHSKIATVVSRCLTSVFGKNAYEFEIKFEKKRGKTEALLLFCRNGKYVDPLSAAGGGVVDIASFALRITSILSALPVLRKLVILDEPFRHLAPELRPIAVQLLKELSEELEIQFIVVSHFTKEELSTLEDCGKVVQI